MKNETEIKDKIKILEGKLKENRARADKIHRNGRLIPDYLENEYGELSARISELEWVLTVETVKLREVCPSCKGLGKIKTVFSEYVDCNDDFHKARE